MNFTTVVKKAMEQTNVKTADIARATGYSYQHIYDLLAGQRRWNEESMDRVCEALGIEINFNVEGTVPALTENP